VEGEREPCPDHERNQVDRLEKKGVLSERATSFWLNCPIVKVGNGR